MAARTDSWVEFDLSNGQHASVRIYSDTPTHASYDLTIGGKLVEKGTPLGIWNTDTLRSGIRKKYDCQNP